MFNSCYYEFNVGMHYVKFNKVYNVRICFYVLNIILLVNVSKTCFQLSYHLFKIGLFCIISRCRCPNMFSYAITLRLMKIQVTEGKRSALTVLLHYHPVICFQMWLAVTNLIFLNDTYLIPYLYFLINYKATIFLLCSHNFKKTFQKNIKYLKFSAKSKTTAKYNKQFPCRNASTWFAFCLKGFDDVFSFL